MHESATNLGLANERSPAARLSPLLTYHELITQPSPDLYRVETFQFEQHLDLLGDLCKTGMLQRQDICLSFDDGHRSNAELAHPILERHELKAIFFITAQWTSTRSIAMSWSQLRELVSTGHSVQSHGWSHRFLVHCNAAELEDELRRSKESLEDQLGSPVRAISMPGGRWNRQVLKACSSAGYRDVYTSDLLFKPVETQGIRLHGRMMVHRDSGLRQLRKFLAGDQWFWMKLRSRHQLKQACKAALGDTAYHALWRRVSGREQSQATPAGDEPLFGPIKENKNANTTAH